MNKVEIGLAVVVIGVIMVIGVLIYYYMSIAIENNPDAFDIGGPPVITNFIPMVAIVLVLALAICIILKFDIFKNEEDKEK